MIACASTAHTGCDQCRPTVSDSIPPFDMYSYDVTTRNYGAELAYQAYIHWLSIRTVYIEKFKAACDRVDARFVFLSRCFFNVWRPILFRRQMISKSGFLGRNGKKKKGL
jgi:hypothetical protein